MATHTADELQIRWPTIEWRKPLKVIWPDGEMFACRICVAGFGLKIRSRWQWETEQQAQRHIGKEHP